MACIMLVEDDPSIVALLHSMFQKEGYEILEAKDGQAALEKLGLGSAPAVSLMPDVIILDYLDAVALHTGPFGTTLLLDRTTN